MNGKIKIVLMEKSMLESVANIASVALGSSFINEEILENEISLCAKNGKNIVAYATSKFIDLDYLETILQKKEIKYLQTQKKIGYIDSIAVREDFQGKGVATLLLKNTLKKLQEKKINYTVMAAWKNKNEINIKGLALKEGFKEEFEIENFWKEDSINYNFDCTVCGKPPCLCSAVIYTKKLNP